MTAAADAFWRDLGAAPGSVLLLDYDGTLAPFRAERNRATPYPTVPPLLESIRTRTTTRLILVSGRPAAEAAGLLGLDPPPETWGAHGWEMRDPRGEVVRQPVPAGASERLDAAAAAALAAGWSGRMERKHAGVALHWRGRPDADAAAEEARALLEAHLGPDLELLPFAAGLELRCTRWNKGRAVADILAAAPESHAVAYLGDDVTDEDAFAVLAPRPRSLPVLVGGTDHPTAALARLRSPGELCDFLGAWLHHARRRPS